AAHLGLQYAILPPPHAALGTGTSRSSCGYARAVGDLLAGGLFSLAAMEEAAPVALRVPATSDGWRAWNCFRTLCDHHAQLSCALELSVDKTSDKELERWLAEPVRSVILPPSAFLLNRSGYPVLPKKAKALLEKLFRHQVQVIICEPATSAGEHEGLLPRQSYVAQLFQALPPLSQADRFAYTHKDTLQAPLQPLADNLESETYELFETDPVKYARYQEAAFIFFTERKEQGRPMPFCAMVLGAGRGPLVEATLKAAERAEVQIELYAVEKNPNAVHALRHRKRRDGWTSVQVVPGDMRSWTAPKKADVIISELLGSFGDNELSPECLDGAQRFLADDGVCIPTSYTAALTPVSAPLLWANARQGAAGGGVADLETAYVVHLQHAFYPCRAIKDCFEFHHPKSDGSSNDRSADLDFEIEVDSLVHGFAGYFDCVLYGSERISIHPETFSVGMFSWFPMFFPLRHPQYLRKGSIIRSHWWRRHDAHKVWYEWALSEPAPTEVQCTAPHDMLHFACDRLRQTFALVDIGSARVLRDMAGTWQGQSSTARHLAQTLGARADGAGLVAEALDSAGFRRNHPIFNLIETVETEYCFGLVSAMNRLLGEALASGPGHRNDKFVFVSDTTLPVKPFKTIQRQLTSDDTSHFCFFPVHWLEWSNTSGLFGFLKDFNPWHDASRETERMALKHHQWMVLSRRHAEKAVKADGMFPSLLKELKVNSGLPGTVSGCDDEFWHFNALYSGVNVTGSLETASVHFNGIAGEDIKYDSHRLQGQCDTFVYWQSEPRL
ncbi:unnamed protein product, partial [Cladocopium goreaui]